MDYTTLLAKISLAYGHDLILTGVASAGHNPVLFATTNGTNVVIKFTTSPDAALKTEHISSVKSVLLARGYPAGYYLFKDSVPNIGFVTIQPQFQGQHPTTLTQSLLDSLFDTIQLQYSAPLGIVNYDPTRLQNIVEHDALGYWEKASSISDRTRDILTRLRTYVNEVPSPLPQHDFVHGDLHVENLLVNNNHLTGVIDFQDCGLGDAILDLISLGFEWQAFSFNNTPDLALNPWDTIYNLALSHSNEASWRYNLAFQIIDRLAWITAKPQVRLGTEARIKSAELVLDYFNV